MEEIDDFIIGDERQLEELLEKYKKGEVEEFDFDFQRYSPIFGTEFRWNIPYKCDWKKFQEVIKETYDITPADYDGEWIDLNAIIYCTPYTNPVLGFHVWGKDYHDCFGHTKKFNLEKYRTVLNKVLSTLGEVDKTALAEIIKQQEENLEENIRCLNILKSL